MGNGFAITDVHGREVIDSRGNPTVEAEVTTENGHTGWAAVPSGASTGAFEAAEKRDGNKKRYGGKGVLEAVKNVNGPIKEALMGIDVRDQRAVDDALLEADHSPNKQNLGANALLGVSLAASRTAARGIRLPLYRYLGGTDACILPVPMMNILNGGRHADNRVSCQEYMIMPTGAHSFSEGLRWCVEVYGALRSLLKADSLSSAVGDEGGFAPDLPDDEEALSYIMRAIDKAGFNGGEDFHIALDPASTEMYEAAKEEGNEGQYSFWKTGKSYTSDTLINLWQSWCNRYPILSIEDPLAEEDWEGWRSMTERLGKNILIVGDDLFVTNTKRLSHGIETGAANSILIKLNQIGTLSETQDAIAMASRAGYRSIVSHRSGDTEDPFIADLAVGSKSLMIKTGAPCRSERTAKYNRLLRIEEELGKSAIYAGPILKNGCLG